MSLQLTDQTYYKKYFYENGITKQEKNERDILIKKLAKKIVDEENIKNKDCLTDNLLYDIQKKFDKVIIENLILTEKYPSFKLLYNDNNKYFSKNKILDEKQYNKLVADKQIMIFEFNYKVDIPYLKQIIDFCNQNPENYIIFDITSPFADYFDKYHKFIWTSKDFLKFLFDNKEKNSNKFLLNEKENYFIDIQTNFLHLIEK